MQNISTAQDRYNELYKNKNRTDEEQIEFMKLGQALLDTEFPEKDGSIFT